MKLQRVSGAEVVLKGGVYDEVFCRGCTSAEGNRCNLVHAFDDPAVIAGQGTIGLEI